MNFNKPRGTKDWYGDEIYKLNEIRSILGTFLNSYCFTEIITPTFENADLFNKSIGDATDIAQKELYVFNDKKDRIMALRPEGTSGVVRAYVENKLYANKNEPTKLGYFLNLFRYERPQNGRLREFHQFGVEYLNINSELYDIECLILASNIIKKFGLENSIKLKINYLGNFTQRSKWMEKLTTYFENYKDKLSLDSINRLYKNPLRILDDKIDGKLDFVKSAPKLKEFLTSDDNECFNNILKALQQEQISYIIDDSLVRGLDYYTGLVFEFVYMNLDGEELTLIGGGRYSNLVKQTGGPDHIGLGFAIGIERLMMVLDNINYPYSYRTSIDIVLGASNYNSYLKALHFASILRQQGYIVDLNLTNCKKDNCFKFALKRKANYFIFINDNEISVENLLSKTHNLVQNLDEIISIIQE